jgi:hypothetical protein
VIDGEYDALFRQKKIAMKTPFSEGVLMYQKKNFAGALQKFEECFAEMPEDFPTKLYRGRCKKMLQQISEGFNVENWEAVESFAFK